MKKLILSIYLILFGNFQLVAQSDYSIVVSPLQFQLFTSTADENPVVNSGRISWGGAIQPEILVQKKINTTTNLTFGVGYLLSFENYPIKGSVSEFIINADLNTNLLILGESNFLIQSIFSCLLYTSPSPRDATLSRMPSSA